MNSTTSMMKTIMQKYKYKQQCHEYKHDLYYI